MRRNLFSKYFLSLSVRITWTILKTNCYKILPLTVRLLLIFQKGIFIYLDKFLQPWLYRHSFLNYQCLIFCSCSHTEMMAHCFSNILQRPWLTEINVNSMHSSRTTHRIWYCKCSSLSQDQYFLKNKHVGRTWRPYLNKLHCSSMQAIGVQLYNELP